MLSWPISETRTETTTAADRTIHQTTIINPTNWRLRNAAILGRFANDLQRQAVGLPTRMSAQPFNVPGGSEAVNQTQADADDARVPVRRAGRGLPAEAAGMALANEGLLDAQPEDRTQKPDTNQAGPPSRLGMVDRNR